MCGPLCFTVFIISHRQPEKFIPQRWHFIIREFSVNIYIFSWRFFFRMLKVIDILHFYPGADLLIHLPFSPSALFSREDLFNFSFV